MGDGGLQFVVNVFAEKQRHVSWTRHSKQPETLEFIPYGSVAFACDTLKFFAVLDGHVAA
jgi:hypothetical protein